MNHITRTFRFQKGQKNDKDVVHTTMLTCGFRVSQAAIRRQRSKKKREKVSLSFEENGHKLAVIRQGSRE